MGRTSKNSSVEIKSAADLRTIIERYEARGNWTFTFLSAAEDPLTTGTSYGFSVGNIRSYAAKAGGVSAAMADVNQSLTAYRTADDLSTDSFWTPATAPTYQRPGWNTDDVPDDV